MDAGVTRDKMKSMARESEQPKAGVLKGRPAGLSEERLQLLMESSDDAIVGEDLEGKILTWNPAAQKIFGWTSTEAVGQHVALITPADRMDESSRNLEKLRRGESIDHVMTRRVRKDGRTILITLSIYPIKSPDGKIVGAYKIARDITQQMSDDSHRQFLQKAGDVLSSSLDSDQVLSNLARLAIPELADWCAVDLLDANGLPRRVATWHTNPEMVRWAEELLRDRPTDMSQRRGLAKVLRSGQSEFFPTIDEAFLQRFHVTAKQREILDRIQLKSLMIVPLVSRGTTIGAMTFASKEANHYTERELSMAEALGRRAGLAVDNARLFASLDNELKERVRAEFQLAENADELRVLYEAGKQLGSSLDPEDIYRALQKLVAGVMDCENLIVSSYDRANGKITCEYAYVEGRVLNPATFPPVKFDPEGRGMQSGVIVSGRPSLVKNLEQEIRKPGTSYVDIDSSGTKRAIRSREDTQVRSILSVPIRVGGRTSGVVQVMSHDPEAYNDADLRILEGVVSQLSAASQNALLYQQTKRAEDRFRLLVSAMNSGVWEATANGEFVEPQRSWQTFTGQPWSAHKGRGWANAIHPADVPIVTRAWLDGLRHRRTESVEARIWSAEHRSYRYTLTRAVPVLDPNGRVKEWIGTITDINDRKAAEQHSRFMLLLNDRIRALESSDQILNTVVSTLGEHLRVTRAAYIHFDWKIERAEYQAEYLAGVPSMLGIYSFEELGESVIQRAMSGEIIAIDDLRKDEFTRPRYLKRYKPSKIRSAIMAPLVKGGSLQGILAVQDSVPRKWTEDELRLVGETVERAWLAIMTVRADRELKQLNAELEIRVAQRTAELQAANREMEGFTYTVSHDLRGPLRAIMSSSMILIEDFGGELSPEAQHLLERQAGAAKRLGQLIDDVLKLSRLGRADLRKSKVDLTALANEVISEQKLTEGRTLDVYVEPGLMALGDPQLLKLALQNLIENSIKFSKPDVPVRLEVGVREQDGEDVVYVKDNGIGFEQQYMEKIFVPFERLHRDDEYPGTGIGLANVKRIIERHGGRIWAEAEPGRGATFFFTL